jgi:hypothetical protein
VLLIGAGILGAFPDVNLQILGVILNIGGLVLSIVAWFSMKSSIEEHYNVAEPLGLTPRGWLPETIDAWTLSRIMTKALARRGIMQIQQIDLPTWLKLCSGVH